MRTRRPYKPNKPSWQIRTWWWRLWTRTFFVNLAERRRLVTLLIWKAPLLVS